MTFTDDQAQALAVTLDKAENDRTQVGQFSRAHPGMTIEDAYAVQRAWTRLKLDRGRTAIGHKIGLTSRAMQRSSNIDEPDYGLLLDDMLFPDGRDIPFDRFIVPRVEVELAFRLKKPLKGPGVTIFDVIDATDYIVPAIEIIDARIEQIDKASGATRKVFDTISDNASNAGIVLGGRPVRPHDLDLRWISALCYRNGVIALHYAEFALVFCALAAVLGLVLGGFVGGYMADIYRAVYRLPVLEFEAGWATWLGEQPR